MKTAVQTHDEHKQLRAINAELLSALEGIMAFYARDQYGSPADQRMEKIARDVIARARGAR